MTGQTVALIVGIALLASIVLGGLSFMARDVGWGEALRALAFSLGLTALVAASTWLIVYGATGSVR